MHKQNVHWRAGVFQFSVRANKDAPGKIARDNSNSTNKLPQRRRMIFFVLVYGYKVGVNINFVVRKHYYM